MVATLTDFKEVTDLLEDLLTKSKKQCVDVVHDFADEECGIEDLYSICIDGHCGTPIVYITEEIFEQLQDEEIILDSPDYDSDRFETYEYRWEKS